MRALRTEIYISAPIDQVWQALTDFDHWKDWNPTVNQVSGNASVGSKLNITMCGSDTKDAMKYQPTILEANPPRSLRWRATMMSGLLFTNGLVFELKEKNGGTVLVNKEEFSGLMVPLFWGKMNLFVMPRLKPSLMRNLGSNRMQGRKTGSRGYSIDKQIRLVFCPGMAAVVCRMCRRANTAGNNTHYSVPTW